MDGKTLLIGPDIFLERSLPQEAGNKIHVGRISIPSYPEIPRWLVLNRIETAHGHSLAEDSRLDDLPRYQIRGCGRIHGMPGVCAQERAGGAVGESGSGVMRGSSGWGGKCETVESMRGIYHLAKLFYQADAPLESGKTTGHSAAIPVRTPWDLAKTPKTWILRKSPQNGTHFRAGS